MALLALQINFYMVGIYQKLSAPNRSSDVWNSPGAALKIRPKAGDEPCRPSVLPLQSWVDVWVDVSGISCQQWRRFHGDLRVFSFVSRVNVLWQEYHEMVKSVVGQLQRATFFGATVTPWINTDLCALRFLLGPSNPTSVGQIPHLEPVSGNDICGVPCGPLKYPVLCLMGGVRECN